MRRASAPLVGGLLACLGIVARGTLALADGPIRSGLYVPPVNSFIIDPAEMPIALDFGSAPLADVQAQLDAARAGAPDSPIVLTLRGTYSVTDTPLALPSKTSLVLYGTIKAAPDATASSLIAITGQIKVAISGGLLDGNRANLIGIDAEGSIKVNIDAVTVTNTGRDGIVLSGNGNTAWDSGSAITRCDVAHAGGSGIAIRDITQALLLDSFVHDNVGAGILVGAAHSSVVNNSSQANDVGIRVDANDDLVSDNEVRGNRRAGLQLATSSVNTAVLRNILVDNGGTGVDLDGSNNLVYANTLNNNANDLIDRASANWVVPRGRPLDAPVSRYFYPPVIDNPHADPIMNGRNRSDVTMASADFPSVASVQQAYDSARQQNPEDVIVLHLSGDFELDGPPLTLGSNTAVVLDGSIHVTSVTAHQAITAANPVEFLSLSGGTIDCGGRVMEGVFIPSATMANIDAMTVTHCGVQEPRSASNAIHFQRGSGYNIIRGNRVDVSGGRCIWTQNSSARYIVLENTLTRCNQDGVDFDSSTSNSLAIGNVSDGNLRYSVFVEQSDSFNKIYGNSSTTRGHGVGVYNNATSSGVRGVTDKNTVFCNTSDGVAPGLRVGSIATAAGGVAETAGTFLFNNGVRNSAGDAVLFDPQFARSIQNYFSQTVLSGNRTDFNARPSNGAAPPDFFNPVSAVNLALNQPATASSTAPDSDPAGAVDGMAFTSWTAGNESHPSLTVDLGADVRFQRVVLKQTATRAIRRVRLQASEDGVNFIDIPGTSRTIGRVRALAFKPVAARFLRVRIDESSDHQIGLEEVTVYPE